MVATFPKFGKHEWENPFLSFERFGGTVGGGTIGIIKCMKCGYKINAHIAYSSINQSIKFYLTYIYDEKETCESFKMKQALE